MPRDVHSLAQAAAIKTCSQEHQIEANLARYEACADAAMTTAEKHFT